MLNIFALTATEVATEAVTEKTMSFGERASTAGIVTLEGMAVIFAVLAILWGFIEILHLVVYKKPKAAETVETVAKTTDVVEETSETQDNGELIAVITAAIAATMASKGNTTGFRVVSFKKVNK